jgi:hypothetical protein
MHIAWIAFTLKSATFRSFISALLMFDDAFASVRDDEIFPTRVPKINKIKDTACEAKFFYT